MHRLLASLRVVAGLLLLLGLAGAVGHVGTRAAYSGMTANGGNKVSTDAFPAPTGLSGSVLSDGRTVRLTWTPTAAASGYRILRSATAGGPYTLVDTVTGQATSTVDNAPPDGTWRYVVRAYAGAWETPDSNETGALVTATLDHFEIDPIGEQSSGRGFAVTIRARTASNGLVPGWAQTATLTTSNGTISPAITGAFSGGVRTETVTLTGAYSAAQTITVTGGTPAKSGTSAAFKLHDWVFRFKKTTPSSATGCRGGGLRFRDMAEGYAGADPEETYFRVGDGLAEFCGPALTAATTLAAGTTAVRAWFDNGAGSACQITAELYRNGTIVGTPVTVSIAGGAANAERLFAIPTPAISLAVGDRVSVFLTWQGVKACNSTDLHYGGTAAPSRVELTG